MKVLTIAGVGPGDPSLLTLAAVDAIKESTVVSYPVSTRGGVSLAEKIASYYYLNKELVQKLFQENIPLYIF